MSLRIDRKVTLPASEIIRLEGNANYSTVYSANHQSFIIVRSLKFVQGMLPDFLRVHKMHLINPSYIQSTTFSRQGYGNRIILILTMSDGSQITASRRQYSQIRLVLGLKAK